MGIISSILLIILIIVFFLAIIGLGWETFFQGIKKGVDKIGITSIIENATSSSADIIEIHQDRFLTLYSARYISVLYQMELILNDRI